MLRKKLVNKDKFQFREEDILPPLPRIRRNSVQCRLAKKADNKLAYNQAKPVQPGMEGSWKHETARRLNNNPAKSQHHGLRQVVAPPAQRQQQASPDPVLDQIVAKLKSGLQLKTSMDQGAAGTSSPAKQKPIAAVPSSLVEQEAVAITRKSPETSKAPAPPGVVSSLSGGCICFRPLQLVMCQLCGETFRGRVSRVCSLHPRAVYLQDVKACKGCKQSNKEVLREFDLPPGMEKEKKTRWIG